MLIAFPYTIIFIVLIGIFGSIFSQGFYHPDEQFAILELMNYKLGGISWEEFNWDIHLQMRPFLQSSLYYGIVRGLNAIGLEGPFVATTVFRALGYTLGVWSLYLLTITREITPVRYRYHALFFSVFCWFVPFLFFRTSSEAFGSIFFLFGVSSIFLLNKGWAYLIAGTFWGLSFYFRFQMGICIAGVGLWLLLIKRDGPLSIFLLLIGFALIAALATWIDYWGYEEWTVTPWNYFYYNLIEKKVNEFGTSPFWFYLSKPLIKGIPPVSLFLFLGTLLFWWDRPKNILTWATIPFLLVHSLIGHKEVRFLFFIYLLSPLFTVLVWERLKGLLRFKFLVNALLGLAFVVNSIVLLKVVLTPAYSPLPFYSFLNDQTDENELYTPVDSSGRQLTLQMAYYNPDKRKLVPVELEEFLKGGPSGMLITSTYREMLQVQAQKQCKNVKSQYPNWVLQYNWFNWRDRSSIWNIWSCRE